MDKFANMLGYQLVWFSAVIGAATGQAWPALLSAAIFILAQGLGSRERGSDARLVASAVAVGLAMDGALSLSGLLRYASPTAGLPAPAWILAIWAAFAMTLNHSLAFLRTRPAWAAVLGGVGGPLAYLGAARGFGVLQFPSGLAPALLALALGWALAMPLLAALAGRWQPRRAALETPR